MLTYLGTVTADPSPFRGLKLFSLDDCFLTSMDLQILLFWGLIVHLISGGLLVAIQIRLKKSWIKWIPLGIGFFQLLALFHASRWGKCLDMQNLEEFDFIPFNLQLWGLYWNWLFLAAGLAVAIFTWWLCARLVKSGPTVVNDVFKKDKTSKVSDAGFSSM